MSAKSKKVAGSIVAVIFGLFFIGMGILLYIDTSGGNITNPKETTGTVVRLHETTKKSNKLLKKDYTSVNPIVEFTSEDGKKHEFYEIWGTDIKDNKYRPGQQVSVIYSIDFPDEEAMIKQEASFWGVHLVLIALGLVALSVPWLIKITR